MLEDPHALDIYLTTLAYLDVHDRYPIALVLVNRQCIGVHLTAPVTQDPLNMEVYLIALVAQDPHNMETYCTRVIRSTLYTPCCSSVTGSTLHGDVPYTTSVLRTTLYRDISYCTSVNISGFSGGNICNNGHSIVNITFYCLNNFVLLITYLLFLFHCSLIRSVYNHPQFP